jgi:DNA-binding CsgD family transcriptional regulator/tetratricopeptide (TPR) repeat protein
MDFRDTWPVARQQIDPDSSVPAAESATVAAGVAALRLGAWVEARDAFRAARSHDPDDPEALAGLGLACWWLNELDEALRLRERAQAEFLNRDDPAGAARMAMWLARQHALIHGNAAAYSGWMARAERLLEGAPPRVEHGWFELFRHCSSSNPHEVEQAAQIAMGVARTFADTDLELLALAYSGLALVAAGKIADGMRRLDEALAVATGGETPSYEVLGEVYCTLLAACERAADPIRAEQWRQMVDEFVRRYEYSPFSATCRTLYGAMLTASGRWAEAEHELIEALRGFEGGSRAMRVDAIVRLAALRTRQGRLADAQALLHDCMEHPEAATSAAELCLARGEAGQAAAILRRRLRDLGPTETLQAVPLLSLLVEADVAEGDGLSAQMSIERLDAMARTSGSAAITALGELARGRVNRAEGRDAAAHFERALLGFARAGMPFELAQAGVALAEALSELNPQLAGIEAQAALAAFEQLGAARHADASAQLLRRLGVRRRAAPRSRGRLSKRELEVLRLLGDGISNNELAEHLFISRRTAEHHVSSVLSKLGLTRRAEAAAYAVRYQVQPTPVRD